jgi:hypothetical protein
VTASRLDAHLRIHTWRDLALRPEAGDAVLAAGSAGLGPAAVFGGARPQARPFTK